MMNNMKRIREDQKLSLTVLSRATGIPLAKLREAEEGGERLTIGELDKLLAFYQMSASDMMKYRRGKRGIWLGGALVCLTIFLVFGLGLDDWLKEQLTTKPQPIAVEGSDPDGGAQASDETGSAGLAPDPEPSGSDASEGGSAASGSLGDESKGAAGQNETTEGAASGSDGAAESNSGDGSGDPVHDAVDPVGSADDGITLGDAAAAEMAPRDEVILRFWGNVAYSAKRLPELDGNDDEQVVHIIPVEQLSTRRPSWLTKEEQGRYLLNLGNADIWTDTAIEEWQRLRRDGYAVIGLGRQPDVYQPYVMEIGGRKVGFLSLSGLIHEFEQIAYTGQIGLPRAYDEHEIVRAVSNAKEQVDYLFVMPHVGNLRGDEVPLDRQQSLVRLVVEAGGDFIIGNRSLRAQQIETIDGVPVLYSLGRAVSKDARNGLLNYVVDVHMSDSLDKVVVHVGEMDNGMLRFDRDLSHHQTSIDGEFSILYDAVGTVEIDL